MMSQRTYSLATGVIFLLITVGHAMRLGFRWQVILEGRTAPMWFSWVAVLFFGFLAFQGFRLSRRSG